MFQGKHIGLLPSKSLKLLHTPRTHLHNGSHTARDLESIPILCTQRPGRTVPGNPPDCPDRSGHMIRGPLHHSHGSNLHLHFHLQLGYRCGHWHHPHHHHYQQFRRHHHHRHYHRCCLPMCCLGWGHQSRPEKWAPEWGHQSRLEQWAPEWGHQSRPEKWAPEWGHQSRLEQ